MSEHYLEASVQVRLLGSLEERLDFAIENARDVGQKVKDWYFELKSFEKSGKLYEALGIRAFKKYFPITEATINSSSSQDLMDYEKRTRRFEGVHAVKAGFMIAFSIATLVEGKYIFSAVTAVLNTAFNVYPIMLQRYNRSRIVNIVERRGL